MQPNALERASVFNKANIESSGPRSGVFSQAHPVQKLSQFDTAAVANRNIEEEEIKSQNEAGEGGERLTVKINDEAKISDDDDAVSEE